MVYRTALEMRSTATYREFESHPIRQPSLFELRLAYACKTAGDRRAKAARRSLVEGGLRCYWLYGLSPPSFGWLTLLPTNLMFYVYLIQSEDSPDRRYVGFTTDLKTRIKTHNAGGSVHTAKYKPWRLVSFHAFSDKRTAQEFEYYLKSASGRAFANKRFW